MKLYVISKVTGLKTYIDVKAGTRQDLRSRFNGDWFNIGDGRNYNVSEVYAEPETEITNTAAGAVIGGIVGILGGPIGLLIGAGLGGAIGNNSDNLEVRYAKHFNASR